MRNRRNDRKPSHERWLVSYADFITLLFAFFVVLYASSRTDLRKQAEVAQSINSAFTALGIFPANGHGKGAGSVKVPPAGKSPITVHEDLARIKKDLDQKLSHQIAAHTIALQLGPNGLVISLREAGFYNSGSATPLRTSIPTIAKIARELHPTPYALRIEGHTDNVPIHNSKYSSNWELSTARATYMTRLFINDFHINPARLSAAGYAQYHPIASNATAAGRAENRRVDIIVLPHGYLAEPSFATSAPASLAHAAAKSSSHPPAKQSSPQKDASSPSSAIASTRTQKPSPYK